ncbi:MAG TPA: hypothetical protein VH912_06925 [Streptosporangiaceae bacterium]
MAVLVAGSVAGSGAAGASPSPRPTPPTAKRQLDTLGRHILQGQQNNGPSTLAEEGGNEESGGEVLEAAMQWAEARTSPGVEVPGEALAEANAAAAALPVKGGRWSEVTTGPYDNDAPGFADPVWSNYGAGWGLVSGRMTALATDGRWLYAGAADGGVWVSTDHGRHWRPSFQDKITMSIGALWVNPADHSLWVATGEANTNSDSYTGQGVWRSTDHGRSFSRVGGTELTNAQVFRLRASKTYLYAATSRGLWRRSLSARQTTAWTLVLKPDPNPDNSPYRQSMITDVVVRPSAPSTVLAVLAWREGTPYNGFYLSKSGGAPGSFARIAPAGLDNSDIGRTSLAYNPKGDKLYAVIQSPNYLLNGPPAPAQTTILKGVYVSANGDPNGPWTQVADAAKLAASGSALDFPSTYEPGVQAWYNEYIEVDPKDPKHLYLGLEEIFESSDGGTTWHAIGPYWNFGLPCFEAGGPTNCPFTTHPDQHAAVIGSDGTAYFGNDGGVWTRPAALRNAVQWTDRNRDLHSLQYYYAEAGRASAGHGTSIWGGMQDNGTGLLMPTSDTMVSPFGGDGGDTLVDPANADRAAVEYVDASIAITTNGGRTDGSTPAFRLISPACEWNPTLPGCDPSPRFITPFERDVKSLGHWITGGQFVWETAKGFDTVCEGTTCDWKAVYDTGEGHSTTAVETNGGVSYAGWCGPCNPLDEEGTGFVRGLATNFGGTWHAITAPNLPNRYVAALTTDPANPAHVYAVFSGFSRHWIPDAGDGHVFESKDGGTTWTDISGNLPDLPGDDLVVWQHHLVVAMDNGVFIADAARPGKWSVLGRGLPNVVAADLTLYPDGRQLLVASHGRGLWKVGMP